MQAVFETLFSEYDDKDLVLLVSSPEYWDEFYGYTGKLLTMDEKGTDEFRQQAGFGSTIFHFSPPVYDLSGRENPYGMFSRSCSKDSDKESPSEEKAIVLFDKKRAKVGVSLYWGPLSAYGMDFTLKKVEGRWLVVELQRTWIS